MYILYKKLYLSHWSCGV